MERDICISRCAIQGVQIFFCRFFGEPRLSMDALFKSKAGISSLSSKGKRSYKELSRTLRAYLDLLHNIPNPKFMTKPEWWWRTLSCVPYLMALQISDASFYLVPLMERHKQFDFLSYYVPGAIRRLPSWFLMVYCFTIYIGVVRNSKLPHYFQHHMMTGLMLDICIQITWYASNFLPLRHYSGTFGLYYWAGVGSMSILLLLECVRCSLARKYGESPLV